MNHNDEEMKDHLLVWLEKKNSYEQHCTVC